MTASLSENDVSALAQIKTVSSLMTSSQGFLGSSEQGLHYNGELRQLDKLPPIDDIRRINGIKPNRRLSMPVGNYSEVRINKAHVLPIMSAVNSSIPP